MLTLEQILEIARAHCFYPDSDLTALVRAIEKAAEATTIERCAKVCNEVAEEFGPGDWQNASFQCSATIRALLPKEES